MELNNLRELSTSSSYLRPTNLLSFAREIIMILKTITSPRAQEIKTRHAPPLCAKRRKRYALDPTSQTTNFDQDPNGSFHLPTSQTTNHSTRGRTTSRNKNKRAKQNPPR